MTVPPLDRAIDCGNISEGKTHKNDFTSLIAHNIYIESIFSKVGRDVSPFVKAISIIKFETKYARDWFG